MTVTGEEQQLERDVTVTKNSASGKEQLRKNLEKELRSGHGVMFTKTDTQVRIHTVHRSEIFLLSAFRACPFFLQHSFDFRTYPNEA